MLLIAQDKPVALNRPVVFRNLTLIDMRSEQQRSGMTVVVSGNRIAEIGRRIKIPKTPKLLTRAESF